GDGAGVRRLLPGDHAEQGRLARAVRPDDADDAARRQLERQIVDEQTVAEALGEAVELDDVVAQPLGDRDDDLGRGRRLVRGLLHQLLVALDARLVLGLAGFGRGRDPLALALQRALARLLLASLLGEALLFLLQPRGIVALVGN